MKVTRTIFVIRGVWEWSWECLIQGDSSVSPAGGETNCDKKEAWVDLDEERTDINLAFQWGAAQAACAYFSDGGGDRRIETVPLSCCLNENLLSLIWLGRCDLLPSLSAYFLDKNVWLLGVQMIPLKLTWRKNSLLALMLAGAQVMGG